MSPLDSPCSLLGWLGTSTGVNAALGILLSVGLEQWPYWAEHFEAWQKRILVFLMALIIPVFALLCSMIGCGQPATFDGIWSAVVAGGSAFITSQGVHTVVLWKNSK